jgi:festuclavine dehydrogenase
MREAWFNEEKGEIYSSTGKGKIPWISVRDIGAVGYRALTDEVSHDTDHILLGPELLSHDYVGFLCSCEPHANIAITHCSNLD